MTNISVRRFTDHPAKHQGVVLPEDGRWQVVLDEVGNPHLFIRVFVAPGQPGWLCIEDLLPVSEKDGSPLSIGDLIDGEVTECLPPEEEQAAYEEYQAREHVCPV